MKIIIIGHARSGTTALTTALGQHSNIKCFKPYEPFNGINLQKENTNYIKLHKKIMKDFDCYKIIYGQVPQDNKFWKFVKQKVEEEELRIILTDRNPVAMLCSSIYRRKDKNLTFTKSCAEKYFKDLKIWRTFFIKLFKNSPCVLPINYTEYEEWDKMLTKIQKFLNIPFEPIVPTTTKSKKSGKNAVNKKNFAITKKEFNGSRYEKYFNDLNFNEHYMRQFCVDSSLRETKAPVE